MSRLSCRKSWAHTPVATTASKANTKEFTEQGLLMGKFQPEPKTGISHEKMTFKNLTKIEISNFLTFKPFFLSKKINLKKPFSNFTQNENKKNKTY